MALCVTIWAVICVLFVLQRDFSNASIVTLSSAFLEIPTELFGPGFRCFYWCRGMSYWFDLYFDYKVSMPLAEYSIPSSGPCLMSMVSVFLFVVMVKFF